MKIPYKHIVKNINSNPSIEELSDSMVKKMVEAGMARGDVIKIINELDGDTIGDATFENIKKRLVERLR